MEDAIALTATETLAAPAVSSLSECKVGACSASAGKLRHANRWFATTTGEST